MNPSRRAGRSIYGPFSGGRAGPGKGRERPSCSK
jgi:hypothetical protein